MFNCFKFLMIDKDEPGTSSPIKRSCMFCGVATVPSTLRIQSPASSALLFHAGPPITKFSIVQPFSSTPIVVLVWSPTVSTSTGTARTSCLNSFSMLAMLARTLVIAALRTLSCEVDLKRQCCAVFWTVRAQFSPEVFWGVQDWRHQTRLRSTLLPMAK